MEFNIRLLTKEEVQFEILIEDEDHSPRGSFASGDEEADEETVKEIIWRLDHGDLWAWCQVCVKATWGDFSAKTWLGACSYKNEQDFIRDSGYYDSMCEESLEALNQKIRETMEKIKPLIF